MGEDKGGWGGLVRELVGRTSGEEQWWETGGRQVSHVL